MITEFVLLLLFTLYFLFYNKARRLHKLTKNIPEPVPAYPLIGHAYIGLRLKTLSDIVSLLEFFDNKLPEQGIMKVWFGPILGIIVTDPKYIEIIAISRYAASKGPIYAMLFDDAFNGLFITDDETKWRELRKPFVRSLTNKFLNTDYHDVFVRRSKEYAEYIRQNKLGIEFDLFHSLTLVFLDIFSETHLGLQRDGINVNKYNPIEDLEIYYESTVLNISRYNFFFRKLGEYISERGKKIRKSRHNMNKFFEGVLAEREKSDRKCNGKREYYSDFMLRRAAMKKMPYKEILKELADIVFAGSDTSSIVTMSAVVFLAMFPEVQEKAYQEQVSIFGHTKRDPTTDDLASMTYLKMVVKETIRLAGAPGFFKSSSQDIELDEYTIPKEAIVYISTMLLHRNTKYWEKPKEFYPEHFLPEEEAERPSYAYIPFGIAPRACPGFLYGMNSIMVFISVLLRNFQLQTSMKYENIEYDYKLFLQFKGGYNVKFIERNKS